MTPAGRRRPEPLVTTAPEVLPAATRPAPEVIAAAYASLVGDRALSGARSELLRSMLATLWELANEGTGVGDLKIADAALAEMSEAFRVFRPYRTVRKLTMFGSARTQPDDPIYVLARDLAAHVAAAGWMVVTGAGPGIMAAGTEGAGREHSFGVNIRLPHEEAANPFIAQDPKLIEMRYFFTRKLMLIKESHAYAVLPGGFGTQDECYELLTLLQTGKAEPAPVALVEMEGGSYWKGWQRFLQEEAVRPGWVSADDTALFRVVSSVDDAAREVLGFYRNYHSCRWVGDLLVLRLQVPPGKDELADLNRRFADIVSRGDHPPRRAVPSRALGERRGRSAAHRLPLRQAALRPAASADRRGERVGRLTRVGTSLSPRGAGPPPRRPTGAPRGRP